MNDNTVADLYIGSCTTCGTGFRVYTLDLASAYPHLEDIFIDGLPFTVNCTHCDDGIISFILETRNLHS